MKEYIYRAPGKQDQAILLDEKPAVGELVVPFPFTIATPQYFQVKQVVHKHAQTTLLLVVPVDLESISENNTIYAEGQPA